MLFRTHNGELLNIIEDDFLNDRDYYRTILEKVYGVQLPINSLNNYLSIS